MLLRSKIVWVTVMGLILMAAPALAASPVDPAGSSALVEAVNWLQATLLGSVATVAAVIAVSTVGFMMLTGRLDLWRSGRILLGCFILFGAATIARGLFGLASTERAVMDPLAAAAPQPAPPLPRAVDPYAGASAPLAN